MISSVASLFLPLFSAFLTGVDRVNFQNLTDCLRIGNRQVFKVKSALQWICPICFLLNRFALKQKDLKQCSDLSHTLDVFMFVNPTCHQSRTNFKKYIVRRVLLLVWSGWRGQICTQVRSCLGCVCVCNSDPIDLNPIDSHSIWD